MVRTKAVTGKVLAFVLAVLLVVLVPGFCSEAATTNVPGLTWTVDSSAVDIDFTRKVAVSETHKDNSSYAYAYYDTYVETDFSFNFYAKGAVTPYPFTNLQYRFNVSFSSPAFNLVTVLSSSITYYLVSAGQTYQLSGADGWLYLPTVFANNSYITLRVHFAGTLRLQQKSVSGSAATVGGVLRGNASLLEWNCYENADTLYNNNQMLKQLVDGNAGIKGAIEEGNKLQEQGNHLQEEENRLQEEANETSKGILDKITDFFGNFFKNLGDFLLGLIVPSSDELSAFLEEVNAWFGDRLGFIWYPFDLALRLVDALAKGDADTSFQIPPLQLNLMGTEYTVYAGSTVNIDAFGFFKYVRMFTSFLLVSGVVKMAVNKWDEWIGGHTG